MFLDTFFSRIWKFGKTKTIRNETEREGKENEKFNLNFIFMLS
jgi:hypothetical protein